MLLALDVGNTETTIGLLEGATVRAHWRITTDRTRTPDEYVLLLRGLLDCVDVAPGMVAGAAIGSVVPRVTQPLADGCARLLGRPALVVDARSPLPIRVDVEEPLTVGADRLINTLAASRLFGRDTIVVDLGTATTFDCITADGVFLGGIIAPGVLTSAETLFQKTSKLPATELVAPKTAIGRRTEECIRSGVVLGQADLIDGLVARIRAEWPGKEAPLVIATGGLAETFRPLCRSFDRVEPDLTLQGLRMAHEALTGDAA